MRLVVACEKYRRWLSDELDGELDAARARRLVAHLRGCPSCLLYKKKLKDLQEEAVGLGQPSPPPEYWKDFSTRLTSRLLAEAREKKQWTWRQRGVRYAWVGAATFLIAGLSLAFFLLFRPERMAREATFLPFERFLEHVYQEIGGDYRLTELFNLAMMDFLGEEFGRNGPALRLYFPEDPLFVESLSEEEVEFVGREIEKETKWRGG